MVLPKYTNTDVGVSCAISVGWETQNSVFISGVEKVNFPQIILEAGIVNANFFYYVFVLEGTRSLTS